MARLGRADSEAIALLTGRLRSIDVDATAALPALLPMLAGVIGAPRAFGYQVEPSGAIAVAAFGCERPGELADALARWHAEERRQGLGDALAAWAIADAHVARVLVSDGSSRILGWIGVELPRAPSTRDNLLLVTLAPALRERWLLEARLANSALNAAALGAVLDVVPGAAYVVRSCGAVLRANAAGQIALGRDGARVRTTLVTALHGGDASYAVTPLAGAAHGYALVVDKEPARVQAGVRESTVARFGLTPRQTEVLELLVQGHGNREIASLLGCAERTVEVHISQIFEKTGVGTRTALIARIWQLAS
jgi:DNA-binding CsgD family transcriptional regulator